MIRWSIFLGVSRLSPIRVWFQRTHEVGIEFRSNLVRVACDDWYEQEMSWGFKDASSCHQSL
jgi:hypothetical protein